MESICFKGSNRELVLPKKNHNTIYEVIGLVNEKGYFTHLSALYLNGLIELEPTAIYFNVERSKKNVNTPISQEGVDRAFSKPARLSNNLYENENLSLYILNSQFTERLGVFKNKSKVRFTDLERTLIDCTIRPQYSGGIESVLNAYKLAKEKIDLQKLRFYLDKLAFSYPYEQAIGFYLDKAGYDIQEQNLFYTMNRYKIRFYLTHDMHNPIYNAKWNIYVPNEI